MSILDKAPKKTAQSKAQKEIKAQPAKWVESMIGKRPQKLQQIKIRGEIHQVLVRLTTSEEDSSIEIAANTWFKTKYPTMDMESQVGKSILEKRLASEKIWHCIRDPERTTEDGERYYPAFTSVDEVYRELQTNEINSILETIFIVQAYYGELMGIDDITGGDFEGTIKQIAKSDDNGFLALCGLGSIPLAVLVRQMATDWTFHSILKSLPGYAELETKAKEIVESESKRSQDSISSLVAQKNMSESYKEKQELSKLGIDVDSVPNLIG